MEVINYYYQILELKYDATEKEINESYKNKIKKYFNLPFLNENQKVEIKELKKAKFILSNNDLRKKYDSIIFQEIEENNKLKEKDILNKQENLSTVTSEPTLKNLGAKYNLWYDIYSLYYLSTCYWLCAFLNV